MVHFTGTMLESTATTLPQHIRAFTSTNMLNTVREEDEQ